MSPVGGLQHRLAGLSYSIMNNQTFRDMYEAGAAEFAHLSSWLLETMAWRGVLVEPSPMLTNCSVFMFRTDRT